jgi:acyl-homoserine-lactone acylase
MDTFGENPRGVHALQVLGTRRDFTAERLRDAAYDSYQPAFAQLVPGLVREWDALPPRDPLKQRLEGPIGALRGWDFRWGVQSVPNTLAMFWGDEMWRRIKAIEWDEASATYRQIDGAPPREKLEALAAAVERLERDFGRWNTPWGEVNRFQRLTGDIVHPFSDAGASIPVGFSSARWGSLASFGAAPRGGSKGWYGTSGNSFVAVVEFGPKVRAMAVSAGGESGDPKSPHFNDQAQRYASGDLREVYFYPEQLKGKTERVYRPGK